MMVPSVNQTTTPTTINRDGSSVPVWRIRGETSPVRYAAETLCAGLVTYAGYAAYMRPVLVVYFIFIESVTSPWK